MPKFQLPHLPRNVVLLAFTSFCADVSSEMLYPVLPIFLTQDLGAPASVVGIVEGAAEATQNAVQGLSGWYADRIRRNKPVALVGYGLAAVAKPVIGVASTWQVVLAGRVADRLGTGIRSAPRDALIAGSVDESRRGAAFGFEGVGDNLGAVVGPLIAAALLFLLQVSTRVLFLAAFLPGAAAFILVALVNESRRDADHAPGASTPRLQGLPAVYWKYPLSVAVFSIGNSSNAFIILKATSIGIPTELTIVVYAVFNFVAAAVSYPVGDLSDRWGRKGLFVGALVIFIVAYIGFALSGNPFVVAGLFVLYGAYQGVFRSVGKALATDLVPEQIRATGIGLYASAVGLAALVASIVGGQLWVQLGPAATFFFGALCAGLGTVLLITLVPRDAGSTPAA
jgi:MFS family permease